MNWAYSMGTLFRYFFANFCAFAEQWLETVVVWPAYLDVSSRILGIFVNRLDGRTHAVLTTFFFLGFFVYRDYVIDFCGSRVERIFLFEQMIIFFSCVCGVAAVQCFFFLVVAIG